MVSAARSWTRTTLSVRLHSVAKPAQRRKQFHSAEDWNSHCCMHCTTISYPKYVIYSICQNWHWTILIYRTKQDKRKRVIFLHDKLIPQLEEHLRFKGKQIFHHFNGISTQMLTCVLSLLKDRKIYERNIEFVRRLLVLLAILYVPHERREGSGALCLQHLRACAYEDWRKEPTRAAHSRTHEHNSVSFHLPEDTLTCFYSIYI